MVIIPLLRRTKSNGGIRVIIDLLWSVGSNVNDYVPDNLVLCFRLLSMPLLITL